LRAGDDTVRTRSPGDGRDQLVVLRENRYGSVSAEVFMWLGDVEGLVLTSDKVAERSQPSRPLL